MPRIGTWRWRFGLAQEALSHSARVWRGAGTGSSPHGPPAPRRLPVPRGGPEMWPAVFSNDIEPRARGIVAERLGVGPEELRPDVSLADELAVDSLDLIDLALALEAEWGVVLRRRALESVRTYGDLLAAVAAAPRRGARRARVSPIFARARVVPAGGTAAGSSAPASSRPTRSSSWSPTRCARGPAQGSRWSWRRAPTMRASPPPASASRGSPGAASRSACSATTGRRSCHLDAGEEVGREARHLVAVVVERHHVPAPLEHVALDQARAEAPARQLQVGERHAVVVAPVEEECRLRDPSDLAPHDRLEAQQLEHCAERHGPVAPARGAHRGIRDVRPAGLGG